jgi:hypothetical protein
MMQEVSAYDEALRRLEAAGSKGMDEEAFRRGEARAERELARER